MRERNDQPLPQPYDPIRWKASLLLVIFSLALLTVLGRLFWVQVVQGNAYRELARKQYESRVLLRAERGKIYDRSMRDIATMMQTTSFAVDPQMVQNPGKCFQLLSQATGVPASTYFELMKKAEGRFVWLARGINTVIYPDLDTLKDPGLIRLREPKRNFVYGPVASQIIGVTNVDNTGVSGLEVSYDSLLKGQSGFVVMQRDGRGRLRPGVNPERQAARNGNGLQLTIDVDMQRIAEQELARGVRDAGAVSGTVIAIEPTTGDVLAMASFPSFDPSHLDKASSESMRIRGITDQYEPGSTMKAVTAAALIEEKKIKPTDMVDGKNGRLAIRDGVVVDDHPVGRVAFATALEQSSNVVFAQVSTMISDHVYYKYVRDFGFGIPVGIDLPGEVRGVLKRPHEFDATTKTYMSFGYQLASTALQIVNAYATIANGGVMMQPRVVKAITTSAGSVEHEIKPQIIRRVISAETARTLTEMLVGVVERGTGSEAKISGVRIAGKTGTAQQLEGGLYSKKAYTASFVGFYPADRPRVAMIIMLDRPSTSIYGGTAAAPIFRRIVQKTMTSLALDGETRERIAASAQADSVIMPDVRGVDGLVADSVLHRLGLKIDHVEQGIVVVQQPAAGSKVERGTIVTITVQPSRPQQSRPNVVGLPLRRAITILHAAGAEVRVQGSGRVRSQVWNGAVCTVLCE